MKQVFMEPDIISISEKKLTGKHRSMSFANYAIGELWRSFLPERKHIKNTVNHYLYSIAVYPGGHFVNFDPASEFERWACVEVADFDVIPDGLEKLVLPAGTYAVFHYKGSSTDPAIFDYIYNEWLPQSDYELDERPHCEVLGEKYKNNHPDSEEEIWIPVQLKNNKHSAGSN